MLFELSRDYKKAFEMVKRGDRIVGWTYLTSKQSIEAWLSEAQQNINLGCVWIPKKEAENSDSFLFHCDRLKVEFYLPIEKPMIVISKERLEEIASEVIGLTQTDDLMEAIAS